MEGKGVVVITEETMKEAQDKIERLAEEIAALTDEIKSDVEKVQDVWQDENARQYLEQFETLRQEMPKFIQSADNSGKFLGAVVEAYRENVQKPTATAVQGRDINETA